MRDDESGRKLGRKVWFNTHMHTHKFKGERTSFFELDISTEEVGAVERKESIVNQRQIVDSPGFREHVTGHKYWHITEIMHIWVERLKHTTC